jgi:hypothetical protein
VAVEADPTLLDKKYEGEEKYMMNVLKEDYKNNPTFWTNISKNIK